MNSTRIENWLNTHYDPISYQGTDLRIDCPMCERSGNPDTSAHMYISLTMSAVHCFRCGYKGNWYTFVQDVSGESLNELNDAVGLTPLYQILQQRHKLIHNTTIIQTPSKFLTINQALAYTDKIESLSANWAHKYVKRRLLPHTSDWEAYTHLWGVWGGPEGYGKLVFMVEDGWWQCRMLAKDVSPRYISCTAPKGDVLYNYLALTRNDTVEIAEGVISAACLGFSAVALCGKVATKEQLSRLQMASVNTYIICLDSDATTAALALAANLHSAGKQIILRRYNLGDPADYDRCEDLPYTFKNRMKLAFNFL